MEGPKQEDNPIPPEAVAFKAYKELWEQMRHIEVTPGRINLNQRMRLRDTVHNGAGLESHYDIRADDLRAAVQKLEPLLESVPAEDSANAAEILDRAKLYLKSQVESQEDNARTVVREPGARPFYAHDETSSKTRAQKSKKAKKMRL